MEKRIFNIGQSIMQYSAPQDLMDEVNNSFDKRKRMKLPPANDFLVGKIKHETLLYQSQRDPGYKTCNYLSVRTTDWLMQAFKDYVDTLKIGKLALSLSSVWINEMKSGEYNPCHIHSSNVSLIGLSSVMILKLPKSYGKEPSNPERPVNGRLEFLGNTNGQFVSNNFMPDLEIGNFFIFPYDLRHTVYPFSNSKQKRRTLAANVDVILYSRHVAIQGFKANE